MNSSNIHVGFFNYIDGATIQDLGLENVDITTTTTGITGSAAGTLAGYVKNSTIKNVYVDGGTITGSAFMIGGLIGNTYYTSIFDAWSDVDINISGSGSNGYFAGGLVGESAGTTFEKVFSLGDISGTAMNVGGLIGQVIFPEQL